MDFCRVCTGGGQGLEHIVMVVVYVSILLLCELSAGTYQSGVPLQTMYRLLLVALYDTTQVTFASTPVHMGKFPRGKRARKSQYLLPFAPRYMQAVKAVHFEMSPGVCRLGLEGIQSGAKFGFPLLKPAEPLLRAIVQLQRFPVVERE